MGKRYEYRLCQSQMSRVCFVNGNWSGTVDPREKDAIQSCAFLWDYLEKAGAEGWELTGVVNILSRDGENFQQLYLKREKD